MKNSLKGSVARENGAIAIVFDSSFLEYNFKNGLKLTKIKLSENTIDHFKVMKVRNGVVEE